jgi:hypothetical protein
VKKVKTGASANSRTDLQKASLLLELLREYKPEASWDDKERHNKVLRQSPQHWRAVSQLGEFFRCPMRRCRYDYQVPW